MTALDPRTRVLLDALVEVETVTPTHVDHAWRRFAARPPARRRVALALGFGTAALVMAAAAVVLVPSWRTLVVGDASPSAYSEAPASVHPSEPEQGPTILGEPAPTRSTPRQPSPGVQPSSPPSAVEDPAPAPWLEPPIDRPAAPRRGPATDRTRPGSPTPVEPAGLDDPNAALHPVTPSTLSEELALLDRAERALRQDDLDSVGPLLDEHARRFERGVLAEERAALQRALAERRTVEADTDTHTLSTPH